MISQIGHKSGAELLAEFILERLERREVRRRYGDAGFDFDGRHWAAGLFQDYISDTWVRARFPLSSEAEERGDKVLERVTPRGAR